tara:strand:- start:1308 stop:1724 length:417 start_codon:yes stop_codon:yes gene_type:complete
MEMVTTQKGELAALKVDQRAIEKGFVSSKPVFECVYDRVLERDGEFYKVQCKFVGSQKKNPVSGSAVIRLERIGHDHKKAKTYTQEDVDVVVAYIEAVDRLVWLKADKFEGKKAISIRYEPAKNGQKSNVLDIEDVEW